MLHDTWQDIFPEPTEQLVYHNVAKKMREEGWQPHLPIVLVPGFASSALMVKQGPVATWVDQIVWLSLSKVKFYA